MFTPMLEFQMQNAGPTDLIPVIVETTPEKYNIVITKVRQMGLDYITRSLEGAYLKLPSLAPLPTPPGLPRGLPPVPFSRQFIPTFGMFSLVVKNMDLDILASIDGVRMIYYDSPIKAFQAAPLVDKRGWVSSDMVAKRLGVYDAWKSGYTGKGVKVAVIDTGWQPNFMLPMISSYSVPPFPPFQDENGHGTWVLAQIGGKRWTAPNGFVCFGIAPNVSLLSIKAMGFGIGMGSTSGIAKAMEMAYKAGVHIVNMSLGSEGVSEKDSPLCKIINTTSDKIIWAVAAGNSGDRGPNTVGTPGVAKNAITVGSFSYIDADRSHFSSMGPTPDGYTKPDIVCFGGGRSFKPNRQKGEYEEYLVNGTTLGSVLDGSVDLTKEGVEPMMGTSMATPTAVGLIALAKQKDPSLNTQKLFRIFSTKGKSKDNKTGWGLITWEWFE